MTEQLSLAGGRWTYVFTGAPKPYIHPLRSPSGVVVSRAEPPDHVWHRGLWFAIKYVNGHNFWEEVPPYGIVRHCEVNDFDDVVSGDLEWVAPGGELLVREHRRLATVDLAADAYALDTVFDLRAERDLTLDRTPYTTWGGYGGLTLRGAPDWSDTRLLLSTGTSGDRIVGEPAEWCDLSSDAAGITILDHPDNRRHPVPWYGSTRSPVYGNDGWSNFLNAAFLFRDPLDLPAGDRLLVRHRVVVHDGAWDADRAAAAYEEWTA
jgi:hypothetical protein